MQIHITIDGNTTAGQIDKLAAALQALNGAVPFVPSCSSGEVAEKEVAPAETKPEPKSRNKGKAEPKAETPAAEEAPAPAPEVEEKPADKTEAAKVDYAALRAETRELFAAYAEEAGTAKGLSLLQEFDVSKFKDLEDGQLASMRKRLLELGE